MTFPFAAALFGIVFIVAILYFAFFKQDFKKLKAIILPGLFFMGFWVLMYWYLHR